MEHTGIEFCLFAARSVLETLLAGLIAAASLCGEAPSPPQQQIDPASAAQQNRVPALPGQGPDYVISPDDDLDIDVLGLPELSHAYRVSPSGLITIQVLKEPILAGGLTLNRLNQVITKELQTAGMVENPRITIQVKESRVHSVAILGAVKRPQIYPLFGTTTVMDALSQAEGLAPDAGNTAVVTRGEIALRALEAERAAKGPNEAGTATSVTASVDLNKLLERGDPDSNLTLYPGDRVTVQRAGIVYVVGAVNRSGGFVLTNDREAMTVLKAVALAESLKSTALPKKAAIIRRDPQAPGGSKQIPLDVKKILGGRAPDQILLADDILFIPESGAKKAGYRAAEAMAQAASLLVYRVP